MSTVDVAIVGGGVAGLTAALSVDEKFRVGVFVKSPQNATVLAQGGIAAVLSTNDDVESHIADTLRAGGGLCDESAVRKIVQQAPAAVRWLSEMGVQFNRKKSGGFALAQEGGHARRRVAHVGDYSGRAIFSALMGRAKTRQNITFYENQMAVNVAVVDGRCRGFYVFDKNKNAVAAVNAAAVVLATGGAGKVYLYATTANDSTGDGIAMAYRAGCDIINMEFVQFHPTCLYHPSAQNFLITEAMRGEGAMLVNARGEQFISHPDGELAPRDIVARAMDGEMKKSGADCVYLDCARHGESFWRRRFPTVFRFCQSLNINIPSDRVPVVPAAHYCCGGARAEVCGKTDVKNLWAIGETASCGLHGANRLASNSLLEGVVMGRQCAAAVSESLSDKNRAPAAPIAKWDERRISKANEAVMVSHNWDELRRLMSSFVGIVRTDERLRRARRRIEWIREEVEDYYRRFLVTPDFLELRSLALCAELIVEGALSRRESRGLHFNWDCPKQLAATNTVLAKEMFLQRRQSLNTSCPFSQKAIVANAIMPYRGGFAGFCNPACRDQFAAAANRQFANAEQKILDAKTKLDNLIDK